MKIAIEEMGPKAMEDVSYKMPPPCQLVIPRIANPGEVDGTWKKNKPYCRRGGF